MAKAKGLSGQEIRELASGIVAKYPGGIRYRELIKQVSGVNSETPINAIHGAVWDLATRFPGQVVKPSRGLFKPASAEKGVEEAPAVPVKFKEEDFYEAFAAYLRDDLEEVISVRPSGETPSRGDGARQT